MKTSINIPFAIILRICLILIPVSSAFLVASCSSSSGGSGFTPQNTLEGKVFILGSETDPNGDLVLYVNGTDLNGAPLTVADLQTAEVIVGGSTYTNAGAELDIVPVGSGDDVLSLGLVTDYSTSTDNEINDVGAIYSNVLDNLPAVFEAQVITFSNNSTLQLDWTDASNMAAIKQAVATPHAVRDRTALYDAMGFALQRNLANDTDGLVERCRPAHMLVVFTDGEENNSSSYTDQNTLTSLINDSGTLVVMLGTSTANSADLESLAGNQGAVVQVHDAAGLTAEVNNWSASLKSMVKLTLKASTGFAGEAISIRIGTQTEPVVFPVQSYCPTP